MCYSRFKRCVYHRVAHILDAHQDEYHAFNFVTNTVKERKIKRIGWQRLRNQLFTDDSPYIEWGLLESVVEQLNNYYDTHGQFPTDYIELVGTPEPNGTLPYAPDKGDYHIHNLTLKNNELQFVLNAPDSLSPDSHYDWTKHEITFPTHSRFHDMVEMGDVKAPTLHESNHGYTLDVPTNIAEHKTETVDDRVLAVDLGVKKQATAVVLEHGEDNEHEQVTPPQFIDHPAKQKLFRVKTDAEGINNKLSELRRHGKDHTDQFDHLLSEYRQTCGKERRLRKQIQHDVANELVWLATVHNCESIVFESIGQLNASDTTGNVAWSISSWARGDLLENVVYKGELLGVGVETVNPWGTSRHCPRCGERGETVKAPNNHEQCRHGGHFHCPHCGYECDRDVVGAVNVGRKYLSDSKMEVATPAEYISAGNHASFPSPTAVEDGEGARSTAASGEQTDAVSGVQSTTEQQERNKASGRQTHVSQFRSRSLTMKPGERTTGGLQQNHGSNTTQRRLRRSVTQSLLANHTDCT